MRTLHVFESISIDGYFTDQNSDLGWARASREDPETGGEGNLHDACQAACDGEEANTQTGRNVSERALVTSAR